MGKPHSNPGDFEGANPSPDVPLYYYVRDESGEDAELTIEILDAGGTVIRTMSSVEGDQERCEKGNEEPRKPIEHEYAPVEQGLNKWGWNMRSEDVPCIDDLLLHAGYDGPSVGPGRYTARLTLGDATSEASFTVTKDPRSFATDAEIADWVQMLANVKALLAESLYTLDDARRAREQIDAMLSQYDDADLHSFGKQAMAGIDAWEAKITQLRHETYEDEDAWATMLDGQLRYLMDTIDQSGAPITEGMRLRYADLVRHWEELQGELRRVTGNYIEPINDWARERREPYVVQPLDAGAGGTPQT
jgi:hypothetical protein